ncbi:MAG: Flp family type IVb pilin [Chloroflexota bacterium]
MNLFDIVRSLVIEEEGADATEYALLAALIAIALIVGATALGTRINGVFNTIDTTINNQL